MNSLSDITIRYGEGWGVFTIKDDMFVGNSMLFTYCESTFGIYYDKDKGVFVATVKSEAFDIDESLTDVSVLDLLKRALDVVHYG
jgi:hypothetical protein